MESISTSSSETWLSHPDTLWTDHVDQVENYAVQFASSLPDTINRLIDKEIFTGITKWVAVLHDLGKTTTYFQNYIRSKEKTRTDLTQHALISALVTYWVVQRWLTEQKNLNELTEIFSFLAYMVVRSHHGDLNNPYRLYRIGCEQIKIIQKQWHSIDREQLNAFWAKKAIPLTISEIDNSITNLPASFKPQRTLVRFFRKRSDFTFYLITNSLFSVLLDADKSAAGLDQLPSESVNLPADLIDRHRAQKGWDQPKTPFDQLRQKAYGQTLKRVTTAKEQRIFSLQIPTGFGKTFMAFSAALKILDKHRLNRVIYALPFMAIIDQNFEEISEVLKKTLEGEIDSSLLLKHHHLSDVFFKAKDHEYEPREAQLLMEGWHSQIIVTTFVQLFHTLIGYRNRTLRKFHRLANSVIILDEIQAIPFKYWELLNRMIREFAVYFNSYFILVTATEPRLIPPEDKIPLVEPEPFYQAVDRVKLYPELTPIESLEEYKNFVLEKVHGKKRVIVVFNTINSAMQFYSLLRGEMENLHFLSTRIIPAYRIRLIQKLADEESYFLVTTQLIEAGVNLDAEVVFRDLGPLDSINQVAGRCNRFAKGEQGKVYVVKLLDEKNKRSYASYIYDPSLLDLTERLLKNKLITEKEFLRYCDRYFDEVSRFPQNESQTIVDAVANLMYDDDDRAISNFRLIEQNYEKYDVFIEVDQEAQVVWEQYCTLKEIDDFWERRNVYLKIKNRFRNYIISIGEKDLRSNPPPVVNHLYYVSHAQLDEYYDMETGFRTVSETSIW